MKIFGKHIISVLLTALILVLPFASCEDEDFYTDGFIPAGEAELSAAITFRAFTPALETRTAGDAIKAINSLWVMIYEQDPGDSTVWRLEQDGKIRITESEHSLTTSLTGNTRPDGKPQAETETGHAGFRLRHKNGRYKIYAVANCPRLDSLPADSLDTPEKLKSLRLVWDAKDIRNNAEMFGCFTNDRSDAGFGKVEDETVIISPNRTIHAWIRRAASKVTVAFDGSDLKEGVFIYIQSVQIKDIPSQCYLGKNNEVGRKGYTLAVPKSGPDMPDGEIMKYHEEDKADDFEYGEDCEDHRITCGAPHLGSHEETAPAFYFYENMQGAGENMPDKRQDADKDGKLDFPGLPDSLNADFNYRLKDDVLYGTYIEVKGHYVSNNSERLGNGPIIYRFMLGKDVIKNYDAERNYHYKLTLKFKNFANEADWHIEYKEPEPGTMTPEPYYISYLYNHSMMYPFKVNTGGRKIEWIEAKILENNWAPDNASPNVYYEKEKDGVGSPWNGFLSLHKTVNTVLDPIDNKPYESNRQHYYNSPERGFRVYDNFTLGENVNSEKNTPKNFHTDDKYRVEKDTAEENTYIIHIPMYTRAKQMVITTGYTGNNPYVAYQRKARVEITTKLEGLNNPFRDTVPIYQVRRIVNPKGIYRSQSNNSSFHVVLKRLPSEESVKFETFQSEGPWKAYVVRRRNGDGITLSATQGKSELRNDPEYEEAIHGKTGSVIDFNVDFSGGSTENRYAIIRVEYHNYTCQHLIFVRQGDTPDDLIPGGKKWYAKNMRTKSELASSPLDEGSLFKFANWDQPIDALSNKNPRDPWINVEDSEFEVYPNNGNFKIAGPTDTTMMWGKITSHKDDKKFGDPGIPNARVAIHEDYWELRNDSTIEQGYGILYGDEATETADSIVHAYGYDYEHKQGRGMRGCFVYNKQTGKNLFFPIGASGYGHRKAAHTPPWGDAETKDGVLRYAAGRTKLYNPPTNRPLFYDLYKRPGAIYWYNEKNDIYLGWDINYFTFDFNNIDAGNLTNKGGSKDQSDACFIRCVVK